MRGHFSRVHVESRGLSFLHRSRVQALVSDDGRDAVVLEHVLQHLARLSRVHDPDARTHFSRGDVVANARELRIATAKRTQSISESVKRDK